MSHESSRYFPNLQEARTDYNLATIRAVKRYKEAARKRAEQMRLQAKPVPVIAVKPITKAKAKKLMTGGKKTLKQTVKALQKSVRADQAYHTHRRREAQDLTSSATECSYTSVFPTNLSILEGAMSNLRYYDPATPGTLVTADAATGTYTRQIHFSSIYKKILIRNNYQVPVNVKVHSFVPKADTSTTPTAFYTAGITDQTISGADTQPISYITDIDIVNENWKIVKTVSRLLEPGKQFTCYHSVKSFDYDPSNADTHALTYQKKYGAHVWVVRLEGALGHMPSTDVQGTLAGEVDMIGDWTFKITYDAGVNLNDYSYSNTAGAVDSTGLVSNKPISDNQAISTT